MNTSSAATDGSSLTPTWSPTVAAYMNTSGFVATFCDDNIRHFNLRLRRKLEA